MSAEKHFWPRWIFTCASKTNQSRTSKETLENHSLFVKLAQSGTKTRGMEIGSAHEEQLDEKRLRDA